MFHPTHIFPYIDTITGFFVWVLVLLNAFALGVVVTTVLRYRESKHFPRAILSEVAITFNLGFFALLLLHPSVLSGLTTGGAWHQIFHFVLWYYVLKVVLFFNFGLTLNVLIDHAH